VRDTEKRTGFCESMMSICLERHLILTRADTLLQKDRIHQCFALNIMTAQILFTISHAVWDQFSFYFFIWFKI